MKFRVNAPNLGVFGKILGFLLLIGLAAYWYFLPFSLIQASFNAPPWPGAAYLVAGIIFGAIGLPLTAFLILFALMLIAA